MSAGLQLPAPLALAGCCCGATRAGAIIPRRCSPYDVQHSVFKKLSDVDVDGEGRRKRWYTQAIYPRLPPNNAHPTHATTRMRRTLSS